MGELGDEIRPAPVYHDSATTIDSLHSTHTTHTIGPLNFTSPEATYTATGCLSEVERKQLWIFIT